MIVFDGKYFCPKATLECGQVFRYAAVGENDYIVRSSGLSARVFTRGDETVIDCDDEEYFARYFDLDTDYSQIISRLSSFPELSSGLEKGRGIRILKQDFAETVLSFIISANNNIPRIKGIIERLCARYGEKKDGYFAFPTLSALKEVTAADYRALGVGFRDKYLVGATEKLLSDGFLDRIASLDVDGARKLLCTVSGVGGKVADCILLFSLARTAVFPTDTWIFKTYRTETLDTPEKVRKYCLDRYGEYAGYAQQYRFYAARG